MSRTFVSIVIVAVFAACSTEGSVGPDPIDPADVPDPFDAPFTWQTIEFDDAVDFGHVPQPVASPVAAGAIALVEHGVEAGLGESISAGNSHGVGVGFIDIDGDGFEDIFQANGEGYRSAVWRNRGDGTFENVSDASGVVDVLGGTDTYSVAAADYDMDGDLDIYLGAHPRDVLLQNDGTGHFTDVTLAAGAGGPPSSQPGSASKIGAFGDYDGDGWLDIAVASSTFESMPGNGYLLRNNGDGTFADVTAQTGFAVAPTGNPCAVMWSDYDSDGDQDIWVWNDRGNDTENRALLRNDGGTFTNVTTQAGITYNVGNPMGIDGADIDHDGDLDYYVSDIGGNPLMLNNGDGTFTDIADAAGVRGDYGWGLGFEDFNADTWPDIFVAQEDDRDYLTFTNLAESPPRFLEQGWSHALVGDGHNVAVAFADIDHNGTIDIVAAPTSGGRLTLYRNDTDRGTNRWLEVRVPETPGTGEAGGVTARVIVKAGDLVQFRDITAGSSRASQNAMSVRFGLGQYTGADWVAILWPDGRTLTAIGIEGNQTIELR